MSSESRFSVVAMLLAGAACTAIDAQTPAPASAPAKHKAKPAPAPVDDGADDEIVVNGQKPPGSVVGDIPPEQTLSPADVRAYGVNSISDLLDQLSPQTTSVRGRGGETPVVLLNGRRISSFAEIRDLPTEAIERVEILPEEVALKYGFTADQKVVNFVLRPRFRSKTVEAGGGTTTEGGGASGNLELGLVHIRRDNRATINARLQESDQLLESQRGLSVPDASGVDSSPYRTLRPRTRTGTLNGVYARPLNSIFSGTLNATVTATDSHSLNGIDSLVSRDPLAQYSYTLSEHLGGTVNGVVKNWRLNLTGNYDHADSHTRSDVDVGTTARFTNTARSISDTGNVQFVANGKLAQLPAGPLSTTFKVGGTFTGLDSNSQRIGISQDTNLSRQAGNGQINLDLPIASKRTGFLAGIGTLSANANIAVNRLSDFGTLRTYGYGLNWTPRAPLTLIASFTDDQAAPTVAQLGNPVILSAQSRVFDYRTGTTVDVSAISGGNPNLGADDRRVWKLGATWKPLTKGDLTFNVNYVRSRIKDAIASLPEPTADLEAAFPDRFIRDASGTLIRVDTRPTNISSESQQTLRWGFNFSVPLKPSQAVVTAFRKAVREKFGSNNPFAPRPQGAQGDQPPPPPQDGGPPPDGGQPRSAGNGGGGPDGPPGGPPPGGGFGGPPGRGFGGGGGRGAQRFRDNAAGRLQFTVFHTWTLEDKVLFRPGVPVIDLLNGGSIASNGGQPRHQIDARMGYSNNGIGAQLAETWKSGTRVDAAAGSSTGDLHFSSLATTDLRLFFNVGQMPAFIGKEWARNLRVTLAFTNLFDQRQNVRDNLGVTPVRYLNPYLDPAGRSVMISIRKLFSPLPFRPPARPQN